MKKLILSFAFAAGVTTLNAQNMCDDVMSVSGHAVSGFESIKGKLTPNEYDGQWAATASIAGAKSCIIEENSGWFIATIEGGSSEAAAKATYNRVKAKMDECFGAWNKWKFNNVGEHMMTSFYSEGQEANGEGSSSFDWTSTDEGEARDFSNWGTVAKGKTVELELRQKNGRGEGYEVRIKIYNAN